MTVSLCCLVKPGTSYLVVGEESWARAVYEETVAGFRSRGLSPVPATPEIVAPGRFIPEGAK